MDHMDRNTFTDALSDRYGLDIEIDDYMRQAFDDVDRHVHYSDGLLRHRSPLSYPALGLDYIGAVQGHGLAVDEQHVAPYMDAEDVGAETAAGYLAALGLAVGDAGAPDDALDWETLHYRLHPSVVQHTAMNIAMAARTQREGIRGAARNLWYLARHDDIPDTDVYGLCYGETGNVTPLLTDGILEGMWRAVRDDH